ncbi:hypothetical protein F2Q70_00033814 [Brassica cretica]|uniref:EF-hand domain-containing protein n=1 Tax=Brassica cretica TaxID=69181 RepID=A0A8S9JX53_BRACR|nr:hypothetical protein F2Q70_00033814 [Brassica cretica]
MAMIFCNTLLYSSSPFLSPLPSIRSKPSRFSKRVLTVQAQFQSMDQNDLLLRQKFMEFPYVSPSRRELMADLMSTLEDRLHSQLLPCSLPTDVRNFKNPNGSAEASLHIRSGEKSSPIDFVIGSWIHVKIPTGVSLNITSISAFLNSSTEAPNFVVELIQSSPTSLVLILDLPHRKDLVRHPDYLQTFYQDTALDTHRQSLLKLPEIKPYQINELMAEVDKNNSGTIDFEEFVHMMTTKFGERDSKDELSKAFKIIDHDNNGKISPHDIKQIAKELGENFTDNEIEEMIEEADRDKDGEVSLEEFMKMMRRTSYGY